ETGKQVRDVKEARGDALAFSPDGSMVAASGPSHAVYLWDAATGRRLGTLAGHLDYVESLTFSTDGKTLISAGRDEAVRLWNMAAIQKDGKPRELPAETLEKLWAELAKKDTADSLKTISALMDAPKSSVSFLSAR